MNNETSFKQHNKERFIIVTGVKDWELGKCPFRCRRLVCWSLSQWEVCGASSSVFFSEGVPSGISSSGCERCLFRLLANCSLSVDSLPKKGLEKIVLERKKELMRSACWVVSEWPNLLMGALIRERK